MLQDVLGEDQIELPMTRFEELLASADVVNGVPAAPAVL
jgi:hypothetical protein